MLTLEIPKDNVTFRFKDGYAFSNKLYIVYPKEKDAFREDAIKKSCINKPKFEFDFENFDFKDYKLLELDKEMRLKVEDLEKNTYLKFRITENSIKIQELEIKKDFISIFHNPLETIETEAKVYSGVLSKFVSLFKNKRFAIYFKDPWFFVDSEKFEMYFGKSLEPDSLDKKNKHEKAGDVQEEITDPYKDIDYLLEKIRKDGKIHTGRD